MNIRHLNKHNFDWLKRLNPLQFIQGKTSESSILDIDSTSIESYRMSIVSAIKNYDSLVTRMSKNISQIENEIYESLSRIKPLKTKFGPYTFTAKYLQNGHTQYFREKNSHKQLMFDTSYIANVYSKHDYCLVKNINYSLKLDLIFILCDIHGNDNNTLFIKSLKKYNKKSITNVDNIGFLDTLNKCHIFYTRRINNSMQLRCVTYYRNRLINDRLIYCENDPNKTLGIYKSRDSKIIFITINTSSMSKMLYTIKLNIQGNPKILKVSLNDIFDKLFLEHRHNHIIALTKCNSKYKLIAIPLYRKYNKIHTNWLLDNIIILGFESFNKCVVLHGVKTPSIPIIGLINNYNKSPELKSLIDCGVITPDVNPDFNSDVFHFTLENPAISYVPSFMILNNSKVQMSNMRGYKFKSYEFTSYDKTTIHISVIYDTESDKGIIYFYGFSNQILKLHSEYEHQYLLKCGYKLCFIHSRSYDSNIALKDTIYGIKYLINNLIISSNSLRIVTESAGASIVDDLINEFGDYDITFILTSPHLPVVDSNIISSRPKRIILANVGGLDERTPWWESFGYIINKSIQKNNNIITYLDFKEHGGHNTGSTFIKKISLASHRAAILINF